MSELQPEKRAEVAQKLSNKLKTGMTPLECQLIWAIARQLAEDAVEAVRAALAESVGKCAFLPKDIGYTLAHDLESVAIPFLKVTEIFSEDELIEIAGDVSDAVRIAIAERQDLPLKVSNHLATVGSVEVAHALVQNETAALDDHGFTKITKRFESHQDLLELVAKRADLSPRIAMGLIKKVSKTAREQLETRYGMSPDFVNVLAQEAENHALLDLAEFKTAAEAMQYATDLNQKGELTHTFCLMAIRGGNLPFFEAAIAVRTGTSVQNVELILREGNTQATSLLCTKARLPSMLHREIVEKVRDVIEANNGVQPQSLSSS
ncbi:DUF2336 domain-containing protein [Denitrobaculum tricleocarpae]|uniref:DUF2336 domain-containing protein n=1 Tax=Denitrobaculum tricleocarpae TaxID=2591009 RepID=A0A545TM81_9PROT|nr:DUF2336 domain-containing protein [Denitrobaculum tricleocarpae]TQV78355.1 DUF2336 domain-containing protein [Denitrobaculum tricleocarpae]